MSARRKAYPSVRAFRQNGRHGVGDRSGFGVVHLHRDGLSGGSQVAPQTWIRPVAIQKLFDTIAALQTNVREERHQVAERGITDLGSGG